MSHLQIVLWSICKKKKYSKETFRDTSQGMLNTPKCWINGNNMKLWLSANIFQVFSQHAGSFFKIKLTLLEICVGFSGIRKEKEKVVIQKSLPDYLMFVSRCSQFTEIFIYLFIYFCIKQKSKPQWRKMSKSNRGLSNNPERKSNMFVKDLYVSAHLDDKKKKKKIECPSRDTIKTKLLRSEFLRRNLNMRKQRRTPCMNNKKQVVDWLLMKVTETTPCLWLIFLFRHRSLHFFVRSNRTGRQFIYYMSEN